MKYFYLSIVTFALFSCTSKSKGKPSSTLFSQQLNAVIADAPNRFASFKGEEARKLDTMIVFHSTMNMEGTTKNYISSDEGSSHYGAVLASNVSKEEAKAAVEEWKNVVQPLLGLGYQILPYRNYIKNSQREGYLFYYTGQSVAIYSESQKGMNAYFVFLIVLDL